MCTACHSLSVITAQRMSRDHWQREVEDMVSRGAKGTPDEVTLTVNYLATYFGTKESPEPRRQSAAGALQSSNDVPKGEFIPHRDPATVPGGVTFKRILNASFEPQNWLTYGGSYNSTHYSLLHQITPENVKDLELKWVFQAHWLDPYETTPLVVDGVLYTTQGNDVVALDAATGRLFWIYRYTPAPDARICCGRITRGLAMYGDTLYLAAVDAHLIAIDAKTGNPLWDTTVARTQSGYTMTGAPLLVKDKVIVGVAGGEYGIRGFIAAYDLATGKFDGLLEDARGKPVAINGIWSLSPGNVSLTNNDPAAAPAAEVYFTAGPNHGSGGLFGYLTAVPAELTEGNTQ